MLVGRKSDQPSAGRDSAAAGARRWCLGLAAGADQYASAARACRRAARSAPAAPAPGAHGGLDIGRGMPRAAAPPGRPPRRRETPPRSRPRSSTPPRRRSQWTKVLPLVALDGQAASRRSAASAPARRVGRRRAPRADGRRGPRPARRRGRWRRGRPAPPRPRLPRRRARRARDARQLGSGPRGSAIGISPSWQYGHVDARGGERQALRVHRREADGPQAASAARAPRRLDHSPARGRPPASDRAAPRPAPRAARPGRCRRRRRARDHQPRAAPGGARGPSGARTAARHSARGDHRQSGATRRAQGTPRDRLCMGSRLPPRGGDRLQRR